ncbi:MAG: tetratricopeptide repeat protein [Desulfatibacillaceae bacterium]|nr:tetratricopeptide repeat protein [Desulfatibacillaceae bacterium]
MKNPSFFFAKAVRGYRGLAVKGDPAAQRNLGMMYENGQGLPKNLAEACRWYKRAADKGDVEASYRLGVHMANGRGIPQDKAGAFVLLTKAADQGMVAAQKTLEKLKQKMEQDEIAKAKRLMEQNTP